MKALLIENFDFVRITASPDLPKRSFKSAPKLLIDPLWSRRPCTLEELSSFLNSLEEFVFTDNMMMVIHENMYRLSASQESFDYFEFKNDDQISIHLNDATPSSADAEELFSNNFGTARAESTILDYGNYVDLILSDLNLKLGYSLLQKQLNFARMFNDY
jgi:hypothetical protein